MILKLGHRLNKAGNVVVDGRLETRTSKVVDHRLNLTRRHVAGRTENAAEDKDEVYNVAHHKADILLAKEMVEANYILQEKHSPILIATVQPRSSYLRCAT